MRELIQKPLVREVLLMLVATVAAQLVFGLNDLLDLVETTKTWGDLLTSFTGWFGSFSFALVITIIKQSIIFAIEKLGKVAL